MPITRRTTGWWNMSNKLWLSETRYLILQLMQRSPKLAEAFARYIELKTESDIIPFTEMQRLREIMISEAYELGRADNNVE